VSTTRLVADTYSTVIWHFRLQSLAGLALMWAVMAGIYGLLADHGAGRPRRRGGPTDSPDEARPNPPQGAVRT